MGIWFLIGFIYGVISMYLKDFDRHDESWGELIGCIFLGPLCFLWLAASISQDLIYKKRRK